MSPPYIVGRECMIGVGQFPKFEDQAYAVQEGKDESTLGKLYLVPTAEAPVANIHRDELLREASSRSVTARIARASARKPERRASAPGG